MITIPQHSENGALFDMALFKRDIEQFHVIDEWEIQVEWCTGENAVHIEEISNPPISIKNAEFWSLYAGIYQTIDGCFIGFNDGTERCKLEAVDSSFWDVSGSLEFENHMQNTYGLYRQSQTP